MTKQASGFGGVIRALRRTRSITLEDLANETGISISTLSRIETNQARPTRRFITGAAAFLGTTPDALDLLSGRLPKFLLEAIQLDPDLFQALAEMSPEERRSCVPATAGEAERIGADVADVLARIRM